MKVSELEGDALDRWVGAALGWKPEGWTEFGPKLWIKGEGKDFQVKRKQDFEPSTKWADAGPIIEQERIALQPISDEEGVWKAYSLDSPLRVFRDTSPLVAAMRAFVASEYGDEVPE